MSIPERIFNISKAYLNQVRDRIDSELAERELQASVDAETSGLPPREDSSPDAMIRRAEARIAALRREAEARTSGELGGPTVAASPAAVDPVAASTSPVVNAIARTSTTTPATIDPNTTDYKVLGVPLGSDFASVQAAYEKLARRCDPRRFPDGSTEQKEAERILAKVNASYETLRRLLDPTVNRFGKLELE